MREHSINTDALLLLQLQQKLQEIIPIPSPLPALHRLLDETEEESERPLLQHPVLVESLEGRPNGIPAEKVANLLKLLEELHAVRYDQRLFLVRQCVGIDSEDHVRN